MNRFLWVLVGLMLFAGAARAGEESSGNPGGSPDRDKIRMADELSLKSRLSDMERQIAKTEDEIRYLKDKVESLGRSVDDLKSAH